MTHLPKPDCHQHGAHAVAVGEQYAGAACADPLVGALHELAARRMNGAGQAAGREFLRRADVEQVCGAALVRDPLCGLRRLDQRHVVVPGKPRARGRVARGEQPGSAPPDVCAATCAQAASRRGTSPACRSPARTPGSAPPLWQSLGANDRARASGAIHHDPRLGIGRDRADADRQFAVRAADAARNVHLLVFGERAAVDDHHIIAALDHRIELGRSDARGMQLVLDDLAERLARYIDAGEQLEAGVVPALGAAIENVNLAVALRR